MKAFKDLTVEELFESIAHSGRLYAHEAGKGAYEYNNGSQMRTMPALDTLPEALRYRARVVSQCVDRILEIADELEKKV